MRSFGLLLFPLFSLLSLVRAADASHWASLADKAPAGIIPLNSASYDELLASDREYSATVLLTAMPAQFKCQPCHEFDPSFRQVAASWARQPKHVRDQHFFASLDFTDGQAIYQRVSRSHLLMGQGFSEGIEAGANAHHS